MEDTLTDCMVRVKEDLSQLKKVRDYLRTKTEAEEGCSFTWRTIEAFNSILSVCSSQTTPETNALDILLDSFYYLARNNTDSSAWDNFGFELGIICVKVLLAIERTDIFEVLFSKLLSVITVLSEHHSGIWKAAARQILNVLINKKFSLHYLEETLKSYIFIIRNVESSVLYDFSSRNLGLLKTLSFLVQKVGDYEIQFDIVCTIFLHLSNDTKLMSGFFTTTENKFFHSLQFSDFEGDCRIFLNALNRQRREAERKVYSVCCHALYLGGCFVEPPMGRSCIWVDANKDTERVSFKCGDVASNANRLIFVRFSEMVNVYIYNDNTEGSRRVVIQTKSLKGMHKDLKNDDICLVAENADGTLDFVHFLEAILSERKRKRHGTKASKTVDCLFIDIRSSKEVQDNAITSSNRSGVEHILSNVFSLPEKVNRLTPNSEIENTSAQQLKVNSNQARTTPRTSFAGNKTFYGSQELSPNSFTESLRKHLGLDSPEPKHTFEDSTQTVEFFQNDPLRRSHKLFRSPDKIFNTFDANERENFILDEDKENKPLVAMVKPSFNARRGESQNLPMGSQSSILLSSRTGRRYGSRKPVEGKLSSTQSQDYFRGSSKFIIKKKPSLPKLKRSKKPTSKQFTEKENKNSPNLKEKYFSQNNAATEYIGDPNKTQWKIKKLEQSENFKGKIEGKGKPSQQGKKPAGPAERRKSSDTGKEKQNETEKTRAFRKKTDHRRSEPWREKTQSGWGSLTSQVKEDSDIRVQNTLKLEVREDAKPSLLDPDGYAYKRWCEPTTSERSNFWLKKLNALQKPNTDSNVFEFSEDLDSVVSKSTKKTKSVRSKRSRPGTRNSKRISLRDAKEFLKKTPLHSLEKEKSAEVYSSRITTPEAPRSTGVSPHTEESVKSKSSMNTLYFDRTSKHNSTKEPTEESARSKSSMNSFHLDRISKRNSTKNHTEESARSKSFTNTFHLHRTSKCNSTKNKTEESTGSKSSTNTFHLTCNSPEDHTEVSVRSKISTNTFHLDHTSKRNLPGDHTEESARSKSSMNTFHLMCNSIETKEPTEESARSKSSMNSFHLKCNSTKEPTEESARSKSSMNSFHLDRVSKCNSLEDLGQKNAVDEQFEGESASSEDEEPMLPSKKRERSDEDSSAAITYIEKKPKTAKLFSSKVFLSILRRRLQRAEERDRQHTNKIIRTVRESFDLLVERMKTKDRATTKACLERTEAAAVEAQAESEDLDLREKRIRRTILYFRAGCSVSDLCKALEEHFSMARGALQDWRAQRSASDAAVRVGDRLSGLIKSEMESSIKSSWTWQRDLLFKCASFED